MEVDDVVTQMGCLQTQDKEELVNQMLRLVGTNIDYNTAVFYLEMNQWNVQASIVPVNYSTVRRLYFETPVLKLFLC